MTDEMNIFLDDGFNYGEMLEGFEPVESTEPDVENKDDDKPIETTKEIDTKVEDTKKVEDINTPPIDKGKDINSSNILSSIVSKIQEEGYFDLKEGETLDIKTTEDFVNVLDKIRETALETEQSDWSDQQKEYFNALKNGVPHEIIATHQQRQEAYSSITEAAIEEEGDEGENLRRRILIANFKSKNISEVKAARLVDTFIEKGEDIDEAKDALKELQQAEAANFQNFEKSRQEQLIKDKVAREKKDKDFKEFVLKTTEVIPATKIAPKLKNEIYEGLKRPVSQTEDGRGLDIIGDILYKGGDEARFKLAYLIKITDGLKNMDILSAKKAEKGIIARLDKELRTPVDTLAFTKETDTINDGLGIYDNIDLG
jgi:hypothetical protein